MFDVSGKKILIVGFGKSGVSAAKLLVHHGAKVLITDNDPGKDVGAGPDEISVEVEFGRHSRRMVKDADFVVVSPGVDLASETFSPIKTSGKPIIGELELGYRFCPARMIAVTGTNGKSTTTKLIGGILREAGLDVFVCGNIGNPLSGEVMKMSDKSVAVVEVSSFQLETIDRFRPYIAVLLNVSDDHFERHGDLERYKKEKFRIFENQNGDDWAVVSNVLRGDSLMNGVKAKIRCFGGNGSVSDGEKADIAVGQERHIIVDRIPFRGRHNLLNLESASLVADIMDISDEAIKKGIMNFRALDHRFEYVATFKGIDFIDDSKATNIDATRAALEAAGKKVVLIAGGIDKGGDYASVRTQVSGSVKKMIVIGEAKDVIRRSFADLVEVLCASDMKEAVRMAAENAVEGEAVLLSPMCSSFDMFCGYKERGDRFQKEIFDLFRKKARERSG